MQTFVVVAATVVFVLCWLSSGISGILLEAITLQIERKEADNMEAARHGRRALQWMLFGTVPIAFLCGMLVAR